MTATDRTVVGGKTHTAGQKRDHQIKRKQTSEKCHVSKTCLSAEKFVKNQLIIFAPKLRIFTMSLAPSFNILQKYLYRFHLLSLDVVLGAVVSHVMFWRLSRSERPVDWLLVLALALAVWAVYLVDRFFDNQETPPPTTAHHQFHNQHRETLRKIALSCIALGLLSAIWLRAEFQIFGAAMGVCVVGYLVWLHKNGGQGPMKGAVTAILYTIGVAGSTWLTRSQVHFSEWALLLNFGLIAFQNILLFNIYTIENQNTNQPNLTEWLSVDVSQKIIQRILIFILMTSIVWLYFCQTLYARRVLFIELMMSAGLWYLSEYRANFRANDRYRWLADGVFCLPLMLW
jgi:hypothetical protein